jgi:PAS domain S-box-containing protein
VVDGFPILTDRARLETAARSARSAPASRSRLNRRVQGAFGAAILALLAVGAISYRGVIVSGESRQWVNHTHEVLERLQDLRLSVAEIEASYRGFALTGDESFLESYRTSAARAEHDQSAVRSLVRDNALQERQLPLLKEVTDREIRLGTLINDRRRTGGLAGAVDAIVEGPGLQVVDELQTVIRQLQDEEQRLLVLRTADVAQRVLHVKAVLVLGTLLGVSVAAMAAWIVRRDGERRALAESALRVSEDRYRTLIDGVHDYAILMLDPEGVIMSWNPGAERMTGRTTDESVGQNFARYFPPEDVGRGKPQEILRKATLNGLYEERGVRIRRDGSHFLVNATYTAVRDAAEKLQGFSVISRDLSDATESGAKYRGLLEAAPDAMVVVNQRGEIVLLNIRAEKQLGYPRDELLGQPVTNIIPEGFAERLIADGTRTAADALAQQIGTGIELVARRKDGSEFPIEIMLSPLESAEGILITAAIRDISVRKDAERHLAQMEGRYRGLLEAAPDAMVVVNQGGEIVLLNVQAEKRFDYRRNELIGQQVRNIIPDGFAERLIADGTRTAAEALAQQIGTGIELMGRRRDGSRFPIEIMLSPLESAEGILVTAAIRDITVRKEAERNLLRMEAQYRGLLEAAPDAMVVVNPAGEIVLLNAQAEKQFGYRRDELLWQKVTSIIPNGFAERLLADGLRSAEEASAQRIGTGIELTGHRKDGSVFPIEIMLSPLGSADGVLVTAAIRDITARIAAEADLLQKVEELNRSNEELGQFAYIASHDLQEPLRMVASYTQLLSRRYKGRLDADADEFIGFAVDGANRMQRLIQDLLLYSRVGTKGRDLMDTSSEATLQQALLNLRGAIEQSGALVTHDPLPNVMADELQLIQLFQNLIGNAIKYQGTGVPRVHVSAAQNGEQKWVFSVQDNGIGIDSKYFERIFGMFQRLHKREEFGGTGIGLAICKRIVERHGGGISVESEPGRGSVFHFGLPASGVPS